MKGNKLFFALSSIVSLLIILSVGNVIGSSGLPNPTVEGRDINEGTIYGEDEYPLSMYVYYDIDGKISLEIPQGVIINKEHNMNVTLENLGFSNITNISYEVLKGVYDESANSLEDIYFNTIYSNNKSNLKSKEGVKEYFKFKINDSETYIIYANMSVKGDENMGNNAHFLLLKPMMSGAGLKAEIYSDVKELVKGEENNIWVMMSNIGDQASINGKVKLYYQNSTCGSSFYDGCNNLIMINQSDINLNVNETKNISLRFIPPAAGTYTLFANVSADNDRKDYAFLDTRDLSSLFFDRSYAYFRVNNAGSALRGKLILSEYGFSQGQTSKINLSITNEGNKNPINGKAKLYYQEGYCDVTSSYYSCNNATLIQEKSFSMSSLNEIKDIEFDFTPAIGSFEYTIIFNVSADNDINNGNVDSGYITVTEGGPNAGVKIENMSQIVKAGNSTNITVTVYNGGGEIAQNINVSLYSYYIDYYDNDYYENLKPKFLYSTLIKNISATNSTKISQIVNLGKGYYVIVANITSYLDTNFNNNEYLSSLFVINNGTDVGVRDVYVWNTELMKDEETTITVYPENIGKGNVNGAKIALYANGIEIGKRYIDFKYSPVLDEIIEFRYSPLFTGNLELKAVITHPDDVNNSNNVFSVNYTVYKKKKVNISFDIDAAGFNKYLYDPEYYYYGRIDSGGVYEFETVEGKEGLILNFMDSLYNYNTFEFSGINLSSSEKIKAKYYDEINQNNNKIEKAFALNTSFNYSELRIMSETSLDSIDQKLGELSYFYCKDFSYLTNKCVKNWTESDNANTYSYQNYFGTYSINYNDSFKAGGISETKEFKNVYLESMQDMVTGLTLERGYGLIKFTSEVNISRFKKDPNLLKDNVAIEKGRIYIDSKLNELTDKPAKILMRGIDMHNPLIRRNGNSCNATTCTNKVYYSGNDSLAFIVNKFSEYTVVEGEYCGNDVCNNDYGEDCNSCVADCGSCDEDQETPTTSTTNTTCNPSWSCNFGPCNGGVKSLICTDSRNCGTNTGKPSQTTTCILESVCTDEDGDGYGIGPGCLGFDINDKDPGVNKVNGNNNSSEIPKEDNGRESIIYVIMGVIIMIIILLVIITVYNYKKNDLGKNEGAINT